MQNHPEPHGPENAILPLATAPAAELRTIRLLISGRVQGVFYRATMAEAAQQLNITGWCRNLPDGRVEAIVQGLAGPLDALIAWCHQGPPKAQVHAVDVQAVASDEVASYAQFVILAYQPGV
ncbi:MAG: acylphosphatase [Candidatus Melainabacteria bacterium]|nr:acylphosphatase [Candidatus Melainabacteria bacterium]